MFDSKQVRTVVAIAVAAPALITLIVLAFSWPSARIAPRDLPIGVAGPAAAQLDHSLSAGGAFDVHVYPDAGAARAAIAHRDVYGALVSDPRSLTVYTASAASPTVAQLLDELGASAAQQAHLQARTPVDVVPLATGDPRGAVLSSTVLPLVLGGELTAVLIALALAIKPHWRQLVALTVTSAAIGAGTLLVVQGWLGALPGDHWATWGALALLVLAISSATAGLVAWLGTPGMAVAGGLMIFLGNPFSGVTSAPELLPSAVGRLGQLLPPGAGATLVRDTAYFDGHAALYPLCVLAAWTVAGSVAVILGHRYARRGQHEPETIGRHAVLGPNSTDDTDDTVSTVSAEPHLQPVG